MHPWIYSGQGTYIKSRLRNMGEVWVYIWAANCRGFIQLSRKLSQKLECQESEGCGWWGRQCQARINYSSPPSLKPLWNSPRLANPGHTLTCFGLEVYTCVSEHFLTYQFSCPNMLSQFLYMTLAMLRNKSEDQAETVISKWYLMLRYLQEWKYTWKKKL